MDIINNFFTFLTDRNYRISHKVSMVISILILIFIVDNIIGFSYFYNNQNKIQQVKELNDLLKNPTLDEKSKTELRIIQNDILFHKSIKDDAYDLICNLSFEQNHKQVDDDSSHIQDLKIEKFMNQPTVSIHKHERNYYWHLISSSWFWFLMMIIVPFAAFSNNKQSIWQVIIITITLEAILLIFVWIYAKLLSLIPIINDTPIYNYLINVLITLVLIGTVYYKSKIKKK